MDAAVAGLIGAFGGSGIGLAGALRINAVQRRDGDIAEKRRAFAAYLGALYPAVAELREMPPNKEPDLLMRAIDGVSSEQASWVRTRKGITAMSPHMFGRMDRLSAAVAVVQMLDMPPAVMEAFDQANDYVAELGEERTDELRAAWPGIREKLLDAARLLDG